MHEKYGLRNGGHLVQGRWVKVCTKTRQYNFPIISYGRPSPDTIINGFWVAWVIEMYNHAGHVKALWRHDMETLSALLALCEGNPPGQNYYYQVTSVNFSCNLSSDRASGWVMDNHDNGPWICIPIWLLFRVFLVNYSVFSSYILYLRYYVILIYQCIYSCRQFEW